jgi:hypothetical protein
MGSANTQTKGRCDLPRPLSIADKYACTGAASVHSCGAGRCSRAWRSRGYRAELRLVSRVYSAIQSQNRGYKEDGGLTFRLPEHRGHLRLHREAVGCGCPARKLQARCRKIEKTGLPRVQRAL